MTMNIGTPKNQKTCRQRRAERRAHLQWNQAEVASSPSVASIAAPASELPRASELEKPMTSSTSWADISDDEFLPMHVPTPDEHTHIDLETASVYSTDTDTPLTTCASQLPRAAEAPLCQKCCSVSFVNSDIFENDLKCANGHVLQFECLPYNAGCDQCGCRMPCGTWVARCSECKYDLCSSCQQGSRMVIRNTFLSFDEPKENMVRQRSVTEPFELGCMCAEDSADDESQCSTDVGKLEASPSISIVPFKSGERPCSFDIGTPAAVLRPAEQAGEGLCVFDIETPAAVLRPAEQAGEGPCVFVIGTPAAVLRPAEQAGEGPVLRPAEQAGEGPVLRPAEQAGEGPCVFGIGTPEAVLRPAEQAGEGPCVFGIGTPAAVLRPAEQTSEGPCVVHWNRAQVANSPSVVCTAVSASELPSASRFEESSSMPAMAEPIDEVDIACDAFLAQDEQTSDETASVYSTDTLDTPLTMCASPFGLGCMCTEDSADDESQFSTDLEELDASPSISIVSDHACRGVDCRESNDAHVVVRSSFLDVHVPREQRRRKSAVQ